MSRTIKACGVGIALALCVALALDPQSGVRLLDVWTQRLSAYVVFGLGVHGIATGRRAGRLTPVDVAVRTLLLAGFEWFLLPSRQLRFQDHQPFLLAAALAVFVPSIAQGCASWLALKRLPWRVLLGLPLLLMVPGLLHQLLRGWDASGFWDSFGYDRDAVGIATGQALAGNSFVMPFYQYGLALVYVVFGHFFWVQQLVNAVLALAGAVCLTLATWNLFRNWRAALLAGLTYAFTVELRQFLDITQIEGWYVPMIAGTLFLWSCYWRSPSLAHAALLGLGIGVAFNTRSQGIFYFGLACASPLVRFGLPGRERLRHSLTAFAVVGLSLLPWSFRNFVVEGRFSPSSDQASIALLFNHPRAGFYGLRNDLAPWWDVLKEYERRFPDKQERFRHIQAEFWGNLRADPARHARAVLWRSLAFYGLLPPHFWDPRGPQPTDWGHEWPLFVRTRYTSLFLIFASILGVLRRPGTTTVVLLLFVIGNLAVLFFASQSEARISYPVLPIHALIALAGVWAPAPLEPPGSWSLLARLRAHGQPQLSAVLAGIVAFASVQYTLVGRHNLAAPLREKSVVYDRALAIDGRLRSLNRFFAWREGDARARPDYSVDDRVRVRLRISNYQLPPKTDADRPGVPWFASHPRRETYYFGFLPESSVVAVSFFGARLDAPLREGDLVDVEGRLLATPVAAAPARAYTDFWLLADKVVRIEDSGS